LTTGYTPTCLACCGVSVTFRTPYWECDRGYRHTQVMTTGIRVSSDSSLSISNNCAKLSKPETPQFLWVILNRPFWTSWTFWTILDNVQNVQSFIKLDSNSKTHDQDDRTRTSPYLATFNVKLTFVSSPHLLSTSIFPPWSLMMP
jgi:hypothetical protein